MANDGNIQQAEDVEILFHYSEKNSITELVLGVESIKNIRDNPELTRVIDDLLHRLNIKINISDRKGILEFLRDLAKVSPDKVIEEIGVKKEENLEKVEVREDPESKLTLNKIEMLVEEYETASKKRQSEISDEIKTILDRYKNIKGSEVDRLLNRLRELKKNGILETKLENLIEDKLKTEIPEIEVKKNIVEQFADEMSKDAKTAEEKAFIKETVLKVIDGEEIPKTIEAKEIKLKTEEFVKEKWAELEEERLNKINQAFEDAERNGPEGQRPLIKQYSKAFGQMYEAQTPYTDKDMSNIKMMMEANGESPGVLARAESDVNILLKSIYTNPAKLKTIYNDAKSLDLAGLQQKYLPNLPDVRSFQSLIRTIDADKNAELGLQSMVNAKIKMAEGFGRFVSKFPGGEALLGKVSEKIGGIAIKDFLTGAMEVMTKEGMITGTKTIMQGIMLGSTSAAETAGGSALVTSMATLFAALPPVAVAILVVMAVIAVEVIAYKIYDTVAGWVKSITGSDLMWGVRNFFMGIFGNNWFGKFIGTIAQFGFNIIAQFVLGISTIFAAAFIQMTSTVTLSIFILIGIITTMGAITSQMVSTLVPPPPQATGGTCVPKNEANESGIINCNQNAPENNTGIDKTNFVTKASAWKSGTNYADQCFNDTVNRALCAGINPQYALWVWLHESGASNYGIDNVEDFGIHGNQSVPTKNYDLQIKSFLNLDPGMACPNLNYWLSLATNYLTGGCDPNKEISQSDGKVMTGYKYLEEIKSQWSWIKAGNLPTNIHISKGGSQCNGDKANKPENEYTRPDGTVMVCDAPVDENGNFIGNSDQSYNYDENAKPEPGQTFPGTKCSVASKVVKTTQCWESWSNKNLPGGGGTICSAGCGPSTVSSMLRSGPNGNKTLTPDVVIFEPNSPYNTSGYKMSGDGSSLTEAKKSLDNHGFKTGEVQSTCSQEAIKNWICAGKAVMIVGPTYTGTGGGYIGHIRVMVAVDEKLITVDPYYKNQYPFDDTKGIVEGRVAGPLEGCLTVDLGKD